jgi:hypothetical protein
MTGTLSLAFPGSRKLAAWWRQLAPYCPQTVWFGHLLLHHVEALVRLSRPCRLDRLALFVLKALALAESAPGSPQETLQYVDDRLHLGRQVLGQSLRGLEAEGLTKIGPEGSWRLTILGRQALDHREYPQVRHERRTFHFIDQRRDGVGRRLQFLDVHNSTGIPWPAAEGLEFDLAALQACLRQPEEWKRQHGFPPEAQAILTMESEPGENPSSSQPPAWQRVVVDRPEQISAVLLLAPRAGGNPQLVGLAVRQDGWVLQSSEPLFTLVGGWQEIFPQLTAEPALELWRQAWRAWCEPRAIPAGEINACLVERQGERLRVRAPHHLIERLRATRSDALKGETWLLAGEGAIRTAALVEVVEARSA